MLTTAELAAYDDDTAFEAVNELVDAGLSFNEARALYLARTENRAPWVLRPGAPDFAINVSVTDEHGTTTRHYACALTIEHAAAEMRDLARHLTSETARVGAVCLHRRTVITFALGGRVFVFRLVREAGNHCDGPGVMAS